VWQRYWEQRGRDFTMLAIAQDARGEAAVAEIVRAYGVGFPVLPDPSSTIAAALGFRIVPSGFLVDGDARIRRRHTEDFSIGDPRVRATVDAFLDGREVEPGPPQERMDPRALEQFAEGVAAQMAGDGSRALRLWHRALELDPDNFLIRSQIWSAEHPDRFWPVVDRQWQELQLMKDGYDKPLP
jgi:hypothetical protein